jgi:hypothetical protein
MLGESLMAKTFAELEQLVINHLVKLGPDDDSLDVEALMRPDVIKRATMRKPRQRRVRGDVFPLELVPGVYQPPEQTQRLWRALHES